MGDRYSRWLDRVIRTILGCGISLYFRARVLSNLAVTVLSYTHSGDVRVHRQVASRFEKRMIEERRQAWIAEFIKRWSVLPIQDQKIDDAMVALGYETDGHPRDPDLSTIPEAAFTQILLGKYQSYISVERDLLPISLAVFLDGAHLIVSLSKRRVWPFLTLQHVDFLVHNGFAQYKDVQESLEKYLTELAESPVDEAEIERFNDFIESRKAKYLPNGH